MGPATDPAGFLSQNELISDLLKVIYYSSASPQNCGCDQFPVADPTSAEHAVVADQCGTSYFTACITSPCTPFRIFAAHCWDLNSSIHSLPPSSHLFSCIFFYWYTNILFELLSSIASIKLIDRLAQLLVCLDLFKAACRK